MSFAVGGLPDGLSLDAATGVISGTPNVAGAFTVSLSAINVSGTGTATLALAIAAAMVEGRRYRWPCSATVWRSRAAHR